MTSLNVLSLCHNIAQSGLALLVQSSLILLLGLLLGALLRRHGPQAQLLAYRATLATVALTGIASLIFSSHVQPIWRVSLPADATVMVSVQAPIPPQVDTPAHLPTAASSSEPLPTMLVNSAKTAPPIQAQIPPAASHPISGSRWHLAAVLVWGAGAVSLLFWLCAGQIYLLLLRRKSNTLNGAAADMLRRLCPERALNPPLLLTSPHIRSPFLAGIWHPAIFLPASYKQDFSEDEMRMVLAHEVAHWQNRDNAWLLFVRMICAMLWIQPLLWMLARRMVQTSEENCDIAALTMGCSARSYADCLLSFAERFRPTQLEHCAGNGVVPFRSSLGQRIQKILSSPRRTPPPRWFYPMIAISMGLGMMLGLRLVSGANDSNPSASAVRQYIADCAAGHLAQAYNLLSPRTRYYISYADFAKRGTVILGPGYHYSSLQAIYSLFTEPNLSANIRYEVIVNDPKRPHNVLVRTYLPRAAGHNTITIISIATLLNPKTGEPQLDIVQTAQPQARDIVQKLEARKDQFACYSHLKKIGLALARYVQKHGYRFPHANRWVDELMPYVEDASIFHDPASRTNGKYNYAFNENLSNLPLSKPKSPASVVIVFDSTKGTKNASDTGQSLPRPGRHSGGNDFLFADGHAKWLRGGQSLFSIIDNLPARVTSRPSPGTSHKAIISSALNKQVKTLLHQRNVLQLDLNSAQHQLASAQQDHKLHSGPSSIPRVYADYNALSMQAKKDYIHAIHQHNNELIAHWETVAKVHKWMSKVATLQTTLDALNKQIRYLEWKILSQKVQESKPASAR